MFVSPEVVSVSPVVLSLPKYFFCPLQIFLPWSAVCRHRDSSRLGVTTPCSLLCPHFCGRPSSGASGGPGQLRPPPPTSGTSSGSSRGDNSAGKRSNVDFFRMRHHRNLIDNSGKIMKGLEINSKSDVPILVGKVEINPTKQFRIVLN